MGNGAARKAFGLTVALALVGSAGAGRAGCDAEAVDLRWPGGAAHFSVEIADDDHERALGLMHREKMAAGHGMLFVYPGPKTVAFWMAETLIPLDMLFIGPDGRVKKIHESAKPLDTTPIPGGDGVQFVLEINGGLARKLGLSEGAELRHPSVDSAQAAWSCAAP